MLKYSQEVIGKVQKCYESMMLLIEEIGSKIEMGLTFMEEYDENDPARYQVDGKLVSSADMIRALRLYAFARQEHQGATFFLQWQTEKGEEHIRFAFYNALCFLRSIPFVDFDKNSIDREVWEFIKDMKTSDQVCAGPRGMCGG